MSECYIIPLIPNKIDGKILACQRCDIAGRQFILFVCNVFLRKRVREDFFIMRCNCKRILFLTCEICGKLYFY